MSEFKREEFMDRIERVDTWKDAATEIFDAYDSLKAENERLKDDAIFWKSSHTTLKDAANGEIEKLHQAVKVLRGALKFYGDKDNYEEDGSISLGAFHTLRKDLGEVARQARTETEKILGGEDEND